MKNKNSNKRTVNLVTHKYTGADENGDIIIKPFPDQYEDYNNSVDSGKF